MQKGPYNHRYGRSVQTYSDIIGYKPQSYQSIQYQLTENSTNIGCHMHKTLARSIKNQVHWCNCIFLFRDVAQGQLL